MSAPPGRGAHRRGPCYCQCLLARGERSLLFPERRPPTPGQPQAQPFGVSAQTLRRGPPTRASPTPPRTHCLPWSCLQAHSVPVATRAGTAPLLCPDPPGSPARGLGRDVPADAHPEQVTREWPWSHASPSWSVRGRKKQQAGAERGRWGGGIWGIRVCKVEESLAPAPHKPSLSGRGSQQSSHTHKRGTSGQRSLDAVAWHDPAEEGMRSHFTGEKTEAL